ncbi:MAG: dihydroneopterin aldolase [Microthrixaceae bacterium]|nr:dihydroneopterin aldolase [Microthrixaceae bacterium]
MAGTDGIELNGLRVMASVGVLPEERERAQPLSLDLSMACDLGAAGVSDALEDTVDYGAVTEAVVRACASRHHDLLEALAQRVADVVLAVDLVQAVTVTVTKLRPPVPHDLASAGVRITRRAGGVG